ncbi:hypothetical protein SAMN05518801_102153 [Novosphingobium sp. CF614]|uniref:hypothetical protein n=1 Tax=Novosphingobium sp. CF614 TaxID=1884364 RepID=UPI0008EF03FB|nr:hypothetical protein [Novosphingobium sp. CF614]SFF84492.1 hypothetical protein SAMN05518801_102153 [Novosphingobium sp. CF614]
MPAFTKPAPRFAPKSTFAKIIAPALAAVLALGAVAPAQAATPYERQHHEQTDRHGGDHHQAGRHTASRGAMIRSDINDLRRDIDRASARRMISQREAAGLRRDTAGIQHLYADYARGGLNGRELQSLQRKIDRVRGALHMERHDRDNRPSQSGHRR